MPRSLFPREHGAYAQLAAPMIAACIIAPSVAGLLLAVAASCTFVANESLLVVLGHRGPRMKTEAGPRATRWLAALLGTATVAGALGLVLAPQVLPIAAVCAVFTCVLVGFAWRRKEHTLAGELVAAVSLTGAAAPIAVAGGAPLAHASWLWTSWALGYAVTIFAVHRVIARHKQRARNADILAFLGTLAVSCGFAYLRLLAALPLAVAALVLVIVAPSARYLRPIGVALTAASLVAMMLVIA